uniref:Uncharacterized protein n=1 Tax=Setaria viridis TaxID=4556 RepID=A0A4U6U485_SETVI|nr:hypothetical protein SEVIR_6G028600v2 [Setaria viridis]
MLEAVEQRSTLLWERLRRASETKELLAAEAGSWQAEHGEGSDDDLGGAREPPVSRWRWLKAVSMVAFGGRPAYKPVAQIVPLSDQPPKSGSDHNNLLEAADTDLGADRPQPRVTAHQAQARLSPRDVAKIRSNNPVPQVVMPVPSNLPPSTETVQVPSFLTPRHGVKFGNNNSVPEVVVDVPSNLPRSTETAQQVADQMKKKQQERCLKYSQKALAFAVCTFIGYASAAKASRKSSEDSEPSNINITFKLAMIPFFIALCADLFSLKTKAKYGRAFVFLSSFHLVLMVYLVFISFDTRYAYTMIFLPLVAVSSLLQQKLWPGQQQGTDEKANKNLDSIFELSSLILNWSTFISALMVIFRELKPNEKYEDIAHGAVGLFFFLTIVLGLYLMLVTTVRIPELVRVRYLDVLLICLLVGTIISALISFLHFT